MGFPEDFRFVGSSSKLYNRVVNSIIVPMAKEIAQEVLFQFFNEEFILNYKPKTKQLVMF